MIDRTLNYSRAIIERYLNMSMPYETVPLARIFPNMAWCIFFLLEKVKGYNRQFLEYPEKNRLETKFWLGETISQ